MTRPARTSKPHRRSFENAPRVAANDTVRWIRADDANPGWFLGADRNGVEGYFPQRWFELDQSTSTARALRDYDAAELTIEAGVDVECLETESGWVLVRTAAGDQGWIRGNCVI